VAEFRVLVFPRPTFGFPSDEPVFAPMLERRLPIDVVPATVMGDLLHRRRARRSHPHQRSPYFCERKAAAVEYIIKPHQN